MSQTQKNYPWSSIKPTPRESGYFSRKAIPNALNIYKEYPQHINILSLGMADPYPVGITHTSRKITDVVSKVTVTITGFSHFFPSDVALFLVGPNGKTVPLMANCGGLTHIDPSAAVDLVFDDAGAALTSAPLTSGTYKPTDLFGAWASWYSFGNSIPAPAANYTDWGTALSDFNGINPDGDWYLLVFDMEAGGGGEILGWSIDIEV